VWQPRCDLAASGKEKSRWEVACIGRSRAWANLGRRRWCGAGGAILVPRAWWRWKMT
jgi:hypothetical protein